MARTKRIELPQVAEQFDEDDTAPEQDDPQSGGSSTPIDWDELDAILARHDARQALWLYADHHEYNVSALQDQAIQRALDEARRQIAAGYVDDVTMIADRFGDLDLRAEAQMEIERLLPPGGSIEATLTSHGWKWHAEESRGEPGYLFHNRATYETCWHPSLDARLQADVRHADLYRYIEAGWVAPTLGDHHAIYHRPPDMPEQQIIAAALIHRGRYQPRRTFSDAELQELADSLAAHGILTRLKVFVNERGEFELIAGERRLRAAKLAKLEQVPVEVCEYTLAQIHEISIIDNLQRENLSPVEEGIAYERLASELGISESELSRRMGKNRAYVQQRRAIGRAAPELQQALATGELTFSQVRGICLGSADNHKVQLATLKKLRGQIKEGARISEKDAQREAEKIVLKQVKKDLEGLGWKIADGGNAPSGIWLWSDGERPRSYTSAELLTLAHERRIPGGTPPAARDITAGERVTLAIKGYYQYTAFTPWVMLHGTDVQVLAPEDLPNLLDQIRVDFAAMQARYDAAGWSLTKDGTGNKFQATSGAGRHEWAWLWKGVEELIAKIEAGEMTAEPAPQPKTTKASQQASTPTWSCGRCGKSQRGHDRHWHNNKEVCKACKQTIDAELQAARDAIAAQLTQRWHAWLQSAPLDLLRMMAIAIPNFRSASILGMDGPAGDPAVIKHIIGMDRDALVAAYPQLVALLAEQRGITFPEDQEATA